MNEPGESVARISILMCANGIQTQTMGEELPHGLGVMEKRETQVNNLNGMVRVSMYS